MQSCDARLQKCLMKDKFVHLKNVALENFSTFRIGGNADHLFVVHDAQSLYNVCLWCYTHNIKFKVVGLCSNLVFDDEGYRGAIIVNRTNEIKFDETGATVDAGVHLTNLIQKSFLRGLGGFECLSGIPSTVGGAITNNAGAFGCTFGDFVESVECYRTHLPLNPITLSHEQCKFDYRNSVFKTNNFIITKAKIKLEEKDKNLIKATIARSIQQKQNTQPLYLPSAGSVFKRGKIIPAQIIDKLGLKGYRIGDAQVSTKHAGFIVNLGSAKSEDVKRLVEKLKTEIFHYTGEHVAEEIEFVDC